MLVLSWFEGNRWYARPEDELLPEVKAESNSLHEGLADHLLPENPDRNCFVRPHILELCSMMNERNSPPPPPKKKDPLHNTKIN